MTVLVVILIIALLVIIFIQSSKAQAQKEVNSQGGLSFIFLNLIVALDQLGFELFNDSITTLEFHRKIDQYSFLSFTIKKTINPKEPYLLQLKKIISGVSREETIPWISSPDYSIEKFISIINSMIDSMSPKGQRNQAPVKLGEMEIENNRIWLEIISNEDIRDEYKIVISDFMIRDSIDVDKFADNKRTNEIINEYHSLETYNIINSFSENPLNEIVCTRSFKEYFTKDMFNRAMGIPDWFYIAYPDVTVWLQANLQSLEHELNLNNSTMISEDGPSLDFFRAIVDKYKSRNGLLECSINAPPLLKSTVLLPGIGINTINLEDHIDKAIQLFGNNYETIHHNSYSTEYLFSKKGISLYTKFQDKTKKIFSIMISPVCDAKTLKDISAGKNTFEEMVDAYGEPEMTSTTEAKFWNAGYSGVYFSFKIDKSIPTYPFDRSHYVSKKIDLITINKPKD